MDQLFAQYHQYMLSAANYVKGSINKQNKYTVSIGTFLPSSSFITSNPAAPPDWATFALSVKVQSPRWAKATELVNCLNKS